MGNSSLSGLITKKLVIVAIVFLIVGSIIGYFKIQSIKNDIEVTSIKELQRVVLSKVNAKEVAGITNAISISQNVAIKRALNTNNRSLAINALKGLSEDMRNGTPFKHIKVHIHTKDVHSFLRSWKPNKFGDDLTGFRATINKVAQTKRPLSAIEIGRAGLVMRGLAPIFDENKNYIGSLEFIMGFNSIVKNLQKDDKYMLVLMDEKYKRGNALTDESKLQNYYISQKAINSDFKEDASHIDFGKLKSTGIYQDSKYVYTYVPIKDLNGKQIGIYLIAESMNYINGIVSDSTSVVIYMLVIMLILVIALVIATRMVISSVVVGGIERFKKQFQIFLDFSQFKTNRYIAVEVEGSDEISNLIKDLNKTGLELSKQLQVDMKVLGEITITADKVEQGIYTCKIKAVTQNPMINTLAKTLNNMINNTEKNMTQLRDILESYTNDDFRPQIDIDPKLKADLLAVMKSVNILGQTLNNNAKLNLTNGQTLESNANSMSASVNHLATRANQQAASLEETAAAVEEITSITRNNSQSAIAMSDLSRKVQESANSGQKLANATASAMTEIDEQVSAINEAISVIDQISFQTNILSLNAAVEAATAGEAGKGFAVVAQEVRNLASRSAEAANEIKAIVEVATSKANDGKKISDEMITGYQELDDHVNNTIKLIQDVATSTKEQMQGVEQINDAITTLDSATQQNASEATNVANVADEVSQMANVLVADAKSKKFN